MKKSVRLLKVLASLRPKPYHAQVAPRINLEGRWVERLGFNYGDQITVSVEPKRLVVTQEDKYDSEKAHRQILDLSTVDPLDVIVQYKDGLDIWRKEVIKAQKNGRYYTITSIPYKLSSLAMGDVIKVDRQLGHLFFNRVIRFGPNQTIQVQFIDRYAERQLLKVIEVAGCQAIKRLNGRLTINMPLKAESKELIGFLKHGEKERYWNFKMPTRGAL